MIIVKKRPGPLVSDLQTYQSPLGTVTRSDLYDRYAHTVQGNLLWGDHSGYAMHTGAELIMRAVIAMLDPSSVKNGLEGAFQKLECGLNAVGYKLAADDGRYTS